MVEQTFTLTHDGLDFHAQLWAPQQTPRAVICLVHGHGEHIGRYSHVGAFLVARGYALFGADLRGHGKSKGKRGHTPDYEALMKDVDAVLSKADNLFPGVPKFLYGHSMGGNIVSNYLIRRNPVIKGAILSGPWLRLAFRPSGFMIMLGRIMNSIAPGFSQKSNLNTKHLSRDRDVVAAYENDPLVHDRISARLGLSMMDMGEIAIKDAGKIMIPMLVMHGSADQITSPDASQEFAKRATNSDVQVNIFKGFFHEIHNEPEKDLVFKVIESWLQMKLG